MILLLFLAAGPARSIAAVRPDGLGIEWVRLPGGEFLMGSAADPEASPVHRVVVSPFEMAKTSVTNKQYKACVEAGVCTVAPAPDARCWIENRRANRKRWRVGPLPASFQGDDQPVACVSWEQARTFSRWVGAELPTEAEWEYAARSAGKQRAYPWGDQAATCLRAVMNDGCGRRATWPVCSKPKGNTDEGLCDMAGNVWQWVEDSYHPSYEGAPADGGAWDSPAGGNHVARGGSWDDEILRNLLVARRFSGNPGDDAVLIGFRPVRRSR